MTLSIPTGAAERRELALRSLPEPGALIDGKWRRDLGGGELSHVDPATGQETTAFPVAGPGDVDDAVAAARRGLAVWRDTPPGERADVLRRLADELRGRADELALLTTLEVGTPMAATNARMSTVPSGWFDYYAGWCDKLFGDTFPPVVADQFSYTQHEPVGVVAKLVTWNSPIGGIQMSVAAALAAGCAVIVKPSELAPFVVMRFGQLAADAGVPVGVLGILPSGVPGSEALVSHPGVDKVSFTGGPEIARRITRASADSLTPMVLELGGKSASIVFPDADMQRALAHASSICALSGQGCSLPSRLLVHDDVYDEFVGRMVDALGSMSCGDPFDSSTVMGPLISEGAMTRVLGMIDRAVDDGAHLRLGGRRVGGELERGFFVEPTVLDQVDPTSDIAQSEVFGPVVAVMRFADDDEAVELANGTSYGLAAYVHTKDLTRALRMTRRLESGNVSINGAISPSGFHTPYGGVKDSGYGKEGGREGILEFVATKTINIAL
jgi:aldehyde dehydrogenase (NAD+)